MASLSVGTDVMPSSTWKLSNTKSLASIPHSALPSSAARLKVCTYSDRWRRTVTEDMYSHSVINELLFILGERNGGGATQWLSSSRYTSLPIMSRKTLSSTDQAALSSSRNLKNTFSFKPFLQLSLVFEHLREHGVLAKYIKRVDSPCSMTLKSFVHGENEVHHLEVC